MIVVLVSTYELGRQPFGLASPAAWLRRCGATVTCLDLAVQELDEAAVKRADLVAFYVPMHTATRIALRALENIRCLNPGAHLCAYGLYAPMNEGLLRQRGVATILGGEFEEGLCTLARRLTAVENDDPTLDAPMSEESRRDYTRGWDDQVDPVISLKKQEFLVPDRSDLPELSKYAYLTMPDGERRTVGYTEASRGCKHLCRHCPIVPVYNGTFRVVQRDIVLDDIYGQVESGARHITFGDPDFFNGPKHAVKIVQELHDRHPAITYDVTIKVEHLLKNSHYLPILRDTGCAFVTSAIESVDDQVLEYLDKDHTQDDFIEVVSLLDEIGLALQPTFIAFTPWITLDGYKYLLQTLAELGLVENLPPIQLAIRLLIPAASRLLELSEVQELIGPFDAEALTYSWTHSDPRVDTLQKEVQRIVERASHLGLSRRTVFEQAWNLAHREIEQERGSPLPIPPGRPRETIPYLSEPWYC